MYYSQNTIQQPVNRLRHQRKRLAPARTTPSSTTQTHRGIAYDRKNIEIRNTSAMPSAGSTIQALPTTTQKFLATVAIDGMGASPALCGSLKNSTTTKNIRKTLSAAIR